MNESILVRNLKFAYRGGPTVLDIPELTIARGEKAFLYGPSGTGKTSLLGVLAGIFPLDEGVVRVLGQNLGELSGSQRDRFRGQHIGYIFQMFNLIPYLSARDNILLPLRLRQGHGRTFDEKNLNDLADGLRIGSILSRKATDLSVGQQQRVAAARALFMNPEILIADEPTSSLDHEHRERFLDVFLSQASRRNASVLFVSHDLSLRSKFDRSIGLSEINRVPRSDNE